MQTVEPHIERTSKVLATMMEDDDDTDTETIHDYAKEALNLFPMFVVGKSVRSDADTMMMFMRVFNVLYEKKVFQEFQAPLIYEYFAEPMNELLLLDFFLSFHRVINPKFGVAQITPHVWASFFFALADFFNFLDYLDVDECVTNYLKHMVCLFSIKYQLARSLIEDRLGSMVFVLDEYFRREIFKGLVEEVNGQCRKNLALRLKYKREELALFDGVHDDTYLDDAYAHLDDKYRLSFGDGKYEVRAKHQYDDDYDDEWSELVNNGNVPEIVEEEAEEVDDEHTLLEKHHFFLRAFSQCKKIVEELEEQVLHIDMGIEQICSKVKLNDYSALDQLDHCEVLTALNVEVDYSRLIEFRSNEYKNRDSGVFYTACKFGHLNLVQKIIPHMKLFDYDEFSYAYASPNRAILKWLYAHRDNYDLLRNNFNLPPHCDPRMSKDTIAPQAPPCTIC